MQKLWTSGVPALRRSACASGLPSLPLSGRAPSNIAAAGGGQAAGDPLDVFAVLSSRLDSRAGELAEYAHRARIAGQARERSYDALKPLTRYPQESKATSALPRSLQPSADPQSQSAARRAPATEWSRA